MKPNALIDVGSGPAVLFCHGALMDSSMFVRQIDHLKARYRCIAYDLRPFQLASYSLSDLVDDCLSRMEELGIRRFVLAGLSMGILGIEPGATESRAPCRAGSDGHDGNGLQHGRAGGFH